ncbi:hypothetical protein, partial [Leptospira noumeaensis]|uniref:hypothetical protein n=1 Tax=Leptospira noumeaensis TaxID=2484964 RepID=UPI001ABF7004
TEGLVRGGFCLRGREPKAHPEVRPVVLLCELGLKKKIRGAREMESVLEFLYHTNRNFEMGKT